MTFEEAKEQMRAGVKMTHEYFTSDEFFEIKQGVMVCEGGYDMTRWNRGEEWQQTGWRIYNV